MEHSEKTNFTGLLKKILVNNAVTILFVVICIAGIVLADQPMPYVVGEISSRLFRNLILILALLVPVWAGMGMNFSIVLGAMAAQIGIMVSMNFSVTARVADLFLAAPLRRIFAQQPPRVAALADCWRLRFAVAGGIGGSLQLDPSELNLQKASCTTSSSACSFFPSI